MIKQSFEEATEQSSVMTSSKSAGRRSLMVLRNCPLEDWISTLAKGGGGAKKRFQHCLNPNSSNQLLYLRAIQGQSGENATDPEVARQCTVTERIYWVHLPRRERDWVEFHNGKWFNSMRNKRKTSSILQYSESDGRRFWFGRNSMRSDETKDRATKNWTAFWCNLKLAQEKGLQFFQTRSHAVVFYITLPAACNEKAVCMKTQEELYQKVRLTPRVPRVVVKSNSQHGQQESRSQDARTSWEPSSYSKSYGEICNNTVDYSKSGAFLCAVEQQNTTRENKVKKLIGLFENNQHKESFL